MQQELMVIVKGPAFQNISYSKQFVILLDSKSFNRYMKVTSLAGVVTRWLMELSEYQYIFQRKPGKQNILANYLPRVSIDNNCKDMIEEPKLINKEVLTIVEQESNKKANFVMP